jgi:hypothetical protein
MTCFPTSQVFPGSIPATGSLPESIKKQFSLLVYEYSLLSITATKRAGRMVDGTALIWYLDLSGKTKHGM